jgi:hypothetical protein
VEVLRDDSLRLGLHPGRHEGRQVAHGNSVEHELLADQAHGIDGAHAVLGKLAIGRGLEQKAVAVLLGQGVELLEERPLVVDRHVRSTVGQPRGVRLLLSG